MIYCKIIKRDGIYKVIATEEEKTITLSIKEELADAKELAFALFDMGKVDAVEIEGLLVL